ncbi:MAG: cytochrome C biogenesis protein [Verrucomicrobia bacterium]|nr:MAG: cytochrome C biogenesis protein [Verrucomicrobiota bacterium]
MKRHIPFTVFLVALIWVVSAAFRTPSNDGGLNSYEFGKTPILLNGRIKPLDTVARTSLLLLRDKQTFRTPDGGKIPAMDWLTELLFDGPSADARKIMVIHDPDVLSLFGWRQEEGKYFSYADLFPHLAKIDEQARRAGETDAKLRSRFQQHILTLHRQLILYQRLKNSIQPEDTADLSTELTVFQGVVRPGREAIRQRERSEPYDEVAFNRMIAFGSRYKQLAENGYFYISPPAPGSDDSDTWRKSGELILETVGTEEIDPLIMRYAAVASACRPSDGQGFNRAVTELQATLSDQIPTESRKAAQEVFFNHFSPFYKSMVLYVVVFLLACASWLAPGKGLGRTALYLGGLALALHTGGLLFRMYVEGRPPVTNLYSSAVFVGWGSVLLGLFLERLFRNGIGSVTAAATGFATLLIAHHLSGDGDTMEMMRAVLDSNFWLATHVVVIAIGYSATFLAGFLAIVFIIRGVVSRTLDKATAQTLNQMVYGIVCFALLFSFVGTVLGGIWADQSWGRFWGWDPKENGAALVVLWNAIILHARWGGYIRPRGLMVMAIFGNIVTAWSWFGTNMLGVGLHSYGFMDKAFIWLLIFMISHLVIMGLGGLPPRFWRSRIFASRRDT